MFRAGNACWGSVALVRDEGQPDLNEEEIAFVGRVGAHIAHGLCDALLREAGAAAITDRAPGVIVLDDHGSVRFLTDQATSGSGRCPGIATPGWSFRPSCTRSHGARST